MNKIIGLSLLICIGAVVIDACKSKPKPQPTCTYQVCTGRHYDGWPSVNIREANTCTTITNKARHGYRAVTLRKQHCLGTQYCSHKDQTKTKCLCSITHAKDTHWSEWYEKISDDGSCKKKRVMNQEFSKPSNQIRDNKCPDFPEPRKEFKAC